MINPSLIDHIDKYLLGQLSDTESQAFLQRLEENPEDQEVFAMLSQLGPAFREQRLTELRSKMQTWDQQTTSPQQASPQSASTPTPTLRRSWLSAAAIGLLLVAAVFYFMNGDKRLSGPELFAEHYERYDYYGQQRSDAGRNVDEAYTLYNRGEYDAAIVAFSKMTDNEAIFYKAQAELANKAYSLAITDFSQYIVLNGALTSEAKWYRALTYLALNMQEKTHNDLNDLATEDSAFGKRAKSLLQKMN